MTADPQATVGLPGVDEPGTPPVDRRFRPDIQGLRALAVALVVTYHFAGSSRILPGGFVGVDVFFVISGYVITGMLLRESGSARSTIADFYARRARRIIPAVTLLIVVIVVVTYPLLGALRGNEVAGDGRWAAVFLANWHFIWQGTSYFQALVPPSPLLHLWSLAVEEQFYLAFPLLFLGIVRLAPRQHRQRVLIVVLAIAALLSLLFSAWQSTADPTVAYFSPFTRAWELLAGALVAIGAAGLRRALAPVAAAATWAGLAAIVAAALIFDGSTAFPGLAALIPVLGAVLIIAGGLSQPRGGAELLLGSRLGVRGGEISYSLYLWHYPIIIIATQQISSRLHLLDRAGLLLLAVVIATLSTVLLENPIRNANRLRSRRGLSIVMGLVLVFATVALATGLLAGHRSAASPAQLPGPAHASPALLRAQIDSAARADQLPSPMAPSLLDAPSTPLHPPGIPDRCIADSAASAFPPLCVLGDPKGSETLVLLGDSEANAWSGAVEQVALEHHLRLVIVAMNACQPWLLPTDDSEGSKACGEFRRRARQRILAVKPSYLLVAGNKAKGFSSVQNAAGFSRLLRSLGPSGARLVYLEHPPWFSGSWAGLPPAECASRFDGDLQRCSLPTSTLRRSYGGFDAAMEAAARHGGAAVVGTTSLFCTPQRCPVAIAHRFVYQDRVHMTWQYSSYIGRALSALLDPLLSAR